MTTTSTYVKIRIWLLHVFGIMPRIQCMNLRGDIGEASVRRVLRLQQTRLE